MAPVTVLVPTYEREELIAGALQSALDQTRGDFEILIGDNSESDRTENVVRALGDDRLRYHRNRPNLGPQGNWLDLVERAETDLVVTLHDDDIWHPDYLDTVVPPMLDDPSVAMTFTDFWFIDDDGHRLDDYTELESTRTHRRSLPPGSVDYDRDDGLRLVAVWNAPQPAYAAVLRRDEVLACDFPEVISPLYDIWLSYQLVKRGAKLRYEPGRLTYYRVHPGAVTSAGFARAEDEVFRRIVDENSDRAAVVGEIVEYWSTLRWARATRLMATGVGSCDDSRTELRAAAGGLHGAKKLMARGAGRSRLAWQALRLGRGLRHRYLSPSASRYREHTSEIRLSGSV